MDHQAIKYEYVILNKISSGQRSVASRYGHDNEPSGSTKRMELIDQQSDYQFLKVIAPMELVRRSASKRFTRIRDSRGEADLKI
jgi:hypothetical protein